MSSIAGGGVRGQDGRMNSSEIDTFLPPSRMGWFLWGGVGLAAFLSVSVAPVATFLVLIVGFGFLHVLTELRYVDSRFSTRFDRRWLSTALALVGVIACLRALLVFQAIPYEWGVGLEALIGIVLAILGAAMVPRYRIVIGIGVLVFAVIAFRSPLHALLLVAVLHNLTPLGFFAERLNTATRQQSLLVLSGLFIGVPLLIATGMPLAVMSPLTGLSPDWTPFAAGPVERHLGAFLPPEMIGEPYAFAAFAGAVFAQSMHYLAVIVILPRLQSDSAKTFVPWPKGFYFWAACGAACVALIAFYLLDYGQAKSVYSLFAAIHSWIEIPILIAALSLAEQQQT